MEESLQIDENVSIPGSEIRFTASRSSGPGGQHVNTTSSRVTLHWDVTNTKAFNDVTRSRLIDRLNPRINSEGILNLSVEDERSQKRNREIARERLKKIVLEALREPKRRIPTKKSASAEKKRLADKKRRSAIKQQRSTPSDDD